MKNELLLGCQLGGADGRCYNRIKSILRVTLTLYPNKRSKKKTSAVIDYYNAYVLNNIRLNLVTDELGKSALVVDKNRGRNKLR